MQTIKPSGKCVGYFISISCCIWYWLTTTELYISHSRESPSVANFWSSRRRAPSLFPVVAQSARRLAQADANLGQGWQTGDFQYETFCDQWIPLNSVFEVSMREQALISSIILYFLKWRTNKMSCISSRNRLQTYTINIYYKLNGSQLTFFLTRVNAQLRVFWLERREKVIVK